MFMSIGERIRTERERLGLNQADFAELAGSSKRSQVSWEQDGNRPGADVLAAWAKAGVDVQYVLIGKRSGEIDTLLLGVAEVALVDAYKALRPSEETGQVRISALVKVYNSLLQRIGVGGQLASAAQDAAEGYLGWLDDPADPALMRRAVFRDSTRSPETAIAADREPIISTGNNARIAGRDYNEHGGKSRKP